VPDRLVRLEELLFIEDLLFGLSSVVLGEHLLELLEVFLVTEVRVGFIEVHHSTDNGVNAFALELLLVRVQIFLKSLQIHIEKDGSVMESFLSPPIFASKVKPIS